MMLAGIYVSISISGVWRRRHKVVFLYYFVMFQRMGRPYAINEMTDVLLRVAMLMVDIMCKGSRQNREDMTRIDRLDDQEELRATCYGSRVP
jgi:hypothetical protein